MSNRRMKILIVVGALALSLGATAVLPQGLKCWSKSGGAVITAGCANGSEEWYSGTSCYPVNSGCPF